MTKDAGALTLDPDRLFPANSNTRAIARHLYGATRELPLISPHGHVEPRLLLDNAPFTDPTSLFITPDHYVTRLLHADGIELSVLGVGQGSLSEQAARRAWRLLCERWHLFRGTPVRYWLESEFGEIFEVTKRPSAATADAIYDHIAERLRRDTYRPRALYERFNISVLATTADPGDPLAEHAALQADPTWASRIVPTFRPDRYLEPASPTWRDDVARLGEAADMETGHYSGYLAALEDRRRYFIAHGATSTDHSHADVRTEPLDFREAARIFQAAMHAGVNLGEATAFRRHMLHQMARMSCDDGLVMTLHPGVYRGHHGPTVSRYGADTGSDIPTRVEFTNALQPLLNDFGTHPGFHLVVFTLDETVWSRELAPLAGFYPCVFIGVPWWFLDAPDAIRRFREAVTETAGFYRTSGFVDDTRAFCSIPARHDMSRRIDASFLARLVVEGRLGEDEAHEVAIDLITHQPQRVFKL